MSQKAYYQYFGQTYVPVYFLAQGVYVIPSTNSSTGSRLFFSANISSLYNNTEPDLAA